MGDLRVRQLPQHMNERDVHGGSVAAKLSVQRVDVHALKDGARTSPTPGGLLVSSSSVSPTESWVSGGDLDRGADRQPFGDLAHTLVGCGRDVDRRPPRCFEPRRLPWLEPQELVCRNRRSRELA